VFIMDLSVCFPSVRRVRPAALIACRAGFASRLRWLPRAQGSARGSGGAGGCMIVRCQWNARLNGFSLEFQGG
jgi:hypothetical protein